MNSVLISWTVGEVSLDAKEGWDVCERDEGKIAERKEKKWGVSREGLRRI